MVSAECDVYIMVPMEKRYHSRRKENPIETRKPFLSSATNNNNNTGSYDRVKW